MTMIKIEILLGNTYRITKTYQIVYNKCELIVSNCFRVIENTMTACQIACRVCRCVEYRSDECVWQFESCAFRIPFSFSYNRALWKRIKLWLHYMKILQFACGIYLIMLWTHWELSCWAENRSKVLSSLSTMYKYARHTHTHTHRDITQPQLCHNKCKVIAHTRTKKRRFCMFLKWLNA